MNFMEQQIFNNVNDLGNKYDILQKLNVMM